MYWVLLHMFPTAYQDSVESSVSEYSTLFYFLEGFFSDCTS